MKEITRQTKTIDPELLTIPEIKEAIDLAEEAAYSPAELEAYEGYWKAVSSERTMRDESRREGKIEGKTGVALLMKREGMP